MHRQGEEIFTALKPMEQNVEKQFGEELLTYNLLSPQRACGKVLKFWPVLYLGSDIAGLP